MANIIMDFEFTGLPNPVNKPEIIKVLLKNADNGKIVIENYKSLRPVTTGAKIYCGGIDYTIDADKYFKNIDFVDLIKSIDGDIQNDIFWGFNINTDKHILNTYDIVIPNYIDLAEMCMCTSIAGQMTAEGNSLECVYYYINNEYCNPEHGTLIELSNIESVYNYIQSKIYNYIQNQICNYIQNQIKTH